jgi:SAM-dependent methyltransferase
VAGYGCCLHCPDWCAQDLRRLAGHVDPIQFPTSHDMPRRWANEPRIIAGHIDGFRKWLSLSHEPPKTLAGDGLVLCGGGKYWIGNVIAVRMLRQVDSDTPVKIFYDGVNEPINRDDLRGVKGVDLVDATAIGGARLTSKWSCKSWALFNCGFRRAIFLDADAYPVAHLGRFFQRLERAPFSFWSDVPCDRDSLDWSKFGVLPTSTARIQGGHIAIDLVAGWRMLQAQLWLDQHADYSHFHAYGDQDCWRVALAATSTRSDHIGPATYRDPAFVCHLDRRPLIVHRVRAKFLTELHADLDRKACAAHKPNIKCPDLPGEDIVWSFASKLLDPPARSVFERLYADGVWGPNGSSGTGSASAQAKPFVEVLSALVALCPEASIVDLGCGDGRVINSLGRPVIGVDVSRSHVEALQKSHPESTWIELDLDRDRVQLPAGDVGVLKDVLIHWPNALIRDWLGWAVRSGKWKILVMSYDRIRPGTPAGDCELGGFHALHVDESPLKDAGAARVAEFLHKQIAIIRCHG